jgi:hypothetical protein
MRAILVFTILLLSLTGAVPEPKHSVRGDDLRPAATFLIDLSRLNPLPTEATV